MDVTEYGRCWKSKWLQCDCQLASYEVETRIASFPLHVKKPRPSTSELLWQMWRLLDWTWASSYFLRWFMETSFRIGGILEVGVGALKLNSPSTLVRLWRAEREGGQQPRIWYLTLSAISRAIAGACSKSYAGNDPSLSLSILLMMSLTFPGWNRDAGAYGNSECTTTCTKQSHKSFRFCWWFNYIQTWFL